MKNTDVAKRYAQALFKLASDKEIELKVEENLRAFAKGIHEKRALYGLFHHPLLDASEKIAVLKKSVEGKIEKLSLDFLILLAVKQRFDLLDGVLESYHQLLNESRHFEEVEIITARPISPQLKESLEKILEKKIGEKIISKLKVDPSYIGGASVQIRNRLYDGSIRTKLDNLKLQMVG